MSKKSERISNIVTVNHDTMLEIIRKCIETRRPHMKVGRPGIGKSELDQQIVEEMKIKSIVAHPVVHDPSNYSGLPWVVDNITEDGKTTKVAEFLPIGFLRDLIYSKDILYVRLEDFGQSAPSTQAAAMQLTLERKLDNKPIGPNVVFGINTNRRQDKAAVTGILEPIKSRMLGGIYHLEVDVEGWCKWAHRKGLPAWLIGAIRYRPNFLTDWEPTNDIIGSPCPRTIAACGEVVNEKWPEHLWFDVFTGIAGQGFAGEVLGFYKIYKELPDVKKIIENPEKGIIPQDPTVEWAICAALANYANKKNLGNIIKYFERWYDHKNFENGIAHAEYVLAFFKDTLARHPELAGHSTYHKWAEKYAPKYN